MRRARARSTGMICKSLGHSSRIVDKATTVAGELLIVPFCRHGGLYSRRILHTFSYLPLLIDACTCIFNFFNEDVTILLLQSIDVERLLGSLINIARRVFIRIVKSVIWLAL